MFRHILGNTQNQTIFISVNAGSAIQTGSDKRGAHGRRGTPFDNLGGPGTPGTLGPTGPNEMRDHWTTRDALEPGAHRNSDQLCFN